MVDTTPLAQGQQSQARRGLSVLTKMILSATALVAVVVGTSSGLDLMAMLKIYDEAAKKQEEYGTTMIRREGVAVARRLAVSLAPTLVEINYTLIDEVLAGTTADRLVIYALVADEGGKVVAKSGDTTLPEKIKPLTSKGKAPDPETIQLSGRRAMRIAAPLEYDGKWYGEVWIAYSLHDLDQQLKQIQQERQAASSKSAIRAAGVGGLCILFGIILAIIQGLSISRPVRQLAGTAAIIADGDLSARARITSRDEFGSLGVAFNDMADQIQQLLKDTADKVQLQNEMEIARTVQDRLVAPTDLIELGALKMAGYYQPASFCGGDFWNYFDLGANKTLLVVGDVTGHGVPSAMITASAKSCCDTLRSTFGDDISVNQLMRTMNSVIYESAKRHLQMTGFAGLIDLNERTITFASGGHPMPYLCRMQADGTYKLETLIARGNRLGDLPEWDFPAKTTQLNKGDVLICFTDGITEGMNPAGEEFGEKRLRRAFQANAARDPEQLRDRIVKSGFDFYAGRPPDDDLTLVVLRIG